MPGAGQGIWNRVPSPSWKWSSEEALHRGWQSPLLYPHKSHAKLHETGWKTISENWQCQILLSTGSPPGQSHRSWCLPHWGSSTTYIRHMDPLAHPLRRLPVWVRRPSPSSPCWVIPPALTCDVTYWCVWPSFIRVRKRNASRSASMPWKYTPPPG